MQGVVVALEKDGASRVKHVSDVRARAARDVLKRCRDRELARHCVKRGGTTFAVRRDAGLKAQTGGKRTDHQTHRQENDSGEQILRIADGK